MSDSKIKRQYGTDVHDTHTMTREEYYARERSESMKVTRQPNARNQGARVFLHKSAFASVGDKVW